LNFSDLQNLLKKKFGIDRLADIARELEVSPQAVSNWKSRNNVPYKYLLKIRKRIEKIDSSTESVEKINVLHNEKPLSDSINNENVESYSISFWDFFLLIAENFKIIIIIPSIFCVLAIIYVLFIVSPVYESQAKIMSSRINNNVSEAVGLAAQFGVSLPVNQPEPEWVFPEVIKSRTIAKSMLKRKFDTKEFGPKKSLLQILTYGNKSTNVGIDTLINNGIETLISMIDIKQNSSLYILTVSAFEPKFARDFASVLIEELDAHQKNYNRNRTSKIRKFVDERIIQTEKDLKKAEEALKNFRDRNRRIGNSPALQLEQERLSREVLVLTGVYTTLKQKLETAKIEEVKESDYVVVLDYPEIPILASKPNKRSIVIIAGLIGIACGMLIVFIKEYLKENNKDIEKLVLAKTLILRNIKYFILFRFIRTNNKD